MICGIDEAGRGALAGELVIAACVLKADIAGLSDSKKLTPKKREELFKKIIKNSEYLIVYFSAKFIDDLGLSECLKKALIVFRDKFKDCDIIYDGNLNYGISGIKTMIKADLKIKEVSAASILAKVSRDRQMILFDKIYPNYGYKKHKGYGTNSHLQAISKYGECEISRKTFKIKKFIQPTLF